MPRAGFLKIDAHAHTTLSDGKDSPEAMIEAYIAQNYDACCLTDHDVFNPELHTELQKKYPEILLIPGTEFTYDDPGAPGIAGGMKHILMLFINQMPKDVEDARRQAANIFVAHPITWPGAPRTFPRGVEGVESVNALYGVKGSWLGKLLMFFERLRWQRWRQIGCSDAHSVEQIGTVYTRLRAEKSLLGIRTALLSPSNRDRKIVIDWNRIRRLWQ